MFKNILHIQIYSKNKLSLSTRIPKTSLKSRPYIVIHQKLRLKHIRYELLLDITLFTQNLGYVAKWNNNGGPPPPYALYSKE